MVPLPCIFAWPVFCIENVIGEDGFIEGGARKRIKVSIIVVPAFKLGFDEFWLISRERVPIVGVNNLTVLVASVKVNVEPVGNVIRKASFGPIVSVIEKVKVSPPAKLLTPIGVVKDDLILNDVIVWATKPLIVVAFDSMRCSKLSKVDTVNLSIYYTVGGANNPFNQKEICVPIAIAVEKGDEIVIVCVENEPAHKIEELFIEAVKP